MNDYISRGFVGVFSVTIYIIQELVIDERFLNIVLASSKIYFRGRLGPPRYVRRLLPDIPLYKVPFLI